MSVATKPLPEQQAPIDSHGEFDFGRHLSIADNIAKTCRTVWEGLSRPRLFLIEWELFPHRYLSPLQILSLSIALQALYSYLQPFLPNHEVYDKLEVILTSSPTKKVFHDIVRTFGGTIMAWAPVFCVRAVAPRSLRPWMNALRTSGLFSLFGLVLTTIQLVLQLTDMPKVAGGFNFAAFLVWIGFVYAGLKTMYGLSTWRALKKSLGYYVLLFLFAAAYFAILIGVGFFGSDTTPMEFFRANLGKH